MLHHAVEGPVADDRMSSFPPACCCWQGTCREGLRRRGGRRGGRGQVGARSRPCGAAQQSCAGSGPLPRAGAQLPVDCVLLLGWVAGALLRGCDACRAVGGGLQSGAALIGIRLDVGSLPPRSSSLTVTGCRLGGFPVRRDRWGGERVVGGVLPRISVGTWGLCARLCLVLVCGGRYGLGEGFFSSSWDRVWAE